MKHVEKYNYEYKFFFFINVIFILLMHSSFIYIEILSCNDTLA